MHAYLKAVGFSNVDNRIELDRILGLVMSNPISKHDTIDSNGIRITEIRCDFSERIGITIRGEYDEKGFFHLEHYFPHVIGRSITLKDEIFVNKRIDTDAFTGMCDDIRLGISLIFYLQNSIDYIESRQQLSQFAALVPASLAALSNEGKILLPIEKNDNQIKQQLSDSRKHIDLIKEAREGSQDAIDNLTIEDIDTYSMVCRRARNEDVYSIVESSFIPYGSESDNYTVIGTIKEIYEHKNSLSGEELYELVINVNDLEFSVVINKNSLEGVPAVGRRFKGNIWLQGNVSFSI